MILILRRFRGGPVEGFMEGASLETFPGEAQLKKPCIWACVMWTKADMIISFISACLARLSIGLNLFPFVDNANFFVLGVRAKFLHHSKLERNVYKNRWQNVDKKSQQASMNWFWPHLFGLYLNKSGFRHHLLILPRCKLSNLIIFTSLVEKICTG